MKKDDELKEEVVTEEYDVKYYPEQTTFNEDEEIETFEEKEGE